MRMRILFSPTHSTPIPDVAIVTSGSVWKKSIYKMAGKPPPDIVRGQAFDVGPRYSGLTYIGEGAYGMVW